MTDTARTTRVRGLAPWSPRQATLDLLDHVRAVLIEYQAYLPLTIRQVFYRLVGVHDYDKSEQAYSRLGEHLNRARRSGLIPFNAIRDDGITLSEPPDQWDDAEQLVYSFFKAAERFRVDRQQGQPVRLMFAVEAAGMLPQVERVAHHYGIPVHSSGGFDSLTAKYDLAERLGQWPHVEVLHIGDFDPSGVHLFTSLEDDVRTLARDINLRGDIQFTRLAVTPEQIARLRLPTAPAKVTDRRSFDGEGTVQCEAIPPDELANIITSAIVARVDTAAFAAVLAEEEAVRADLSERLRPLLAP